MNSSDATAPRSPYLRISTSEVLLGMFVCELDRPWKDTPFPIHGFHVRTIDDIESVRRFCRQVVIDTSRGKAPKKQQPQALTLLSSARQQAPTAVAIPIHHDRYPVSRTVQQAVPGFRQAWQDLQTAFNAVVARAKAEQPLGLAGLATPVGAVLDHVCRCPDAAVWTLNAYAPDTALLHHSLRASIWAAILGRHVGLDSDTLEATVTGTLLADIGMTRFPEALVRKRGPFKRKEYLVYQKHVRLGEDILRVDGEAAAEVMAVVRAHHERHDGRGFPRGQRGDQIPVSARIAHIAYSFDRLLRPLDPTRRVSPATAIGRLYKQRRLKFAEQLVFEFIQAMGMYPAGAVVRLAGGETAIVVEQNAGERLKPKLVMVRDAAGAEMKKVRWLDAVADPACASVAAIIKALPCGSHGIDEAELHDRVFSRSIGLGPLRFRF